MYWGEYVMCTTASCTIPDLFLCVRIYGTAILQIFSTRILNLRRIQSTEVLKRYRVKKIECERGEKKMSWTMLPSSARSHPIGGSA